MSNKAFSKIGRITAGIIATMMLIAVLFSAVFIAVESGHDCDGEDCPICTCIHQCENTLHNLGNGLISSSFVISPVVIILYTGVCALFVFAQSTLVSNKVRLNN